MTVKDTTKERKYRNVVDEKRAERNSNEETIAKRAPEASIDRLGAKFTIDRHDAEEDFPLEFRETKSPSG